jgi:hypothetical protein
MLRLLLPVVLLLLGLGAGAGAGLFLGRDAPAAAGDTEAETAAAPETDGDTGAADPGTGGDTGLSGTEFVRLNNQFVVPIVRNGAVRSLVVLSLSIEVDTGGNGAVFDREPRLRDSFLRVMFAHANAGGFDGAFTQASAMDPLREALGEAAAEVLGTLVHDVLIVDITRQDA